MEAESKDLQTITYDPNVLAVAKDEAGNIVFTPEAEEVIIAVLQLEKQVADTLSVMKSAIEEQGLKASKNFTSVNSDRIKVNYSASGAEFGFDDKKRKRFPAPLFKKKVTYTPDSKEIKKYREKTGKWPAHVFVNTRKKSIRLSLKVGNE